MRRRGSSDSLRAQRQGGPLQHPRTHLGNCGSLHTSLPQISGGSYGISVEQLVFIMGNRTLSDTKDTFLDSWILSDIFFSRLGKRPTYYF